MSLPFLKPKQIAGVIISHRKPDSDAPQPMDEMEGSDSALEAAAQDILRAINSKDSQHLAQAIRAAFQILDSEPHEEGPHTNDEMDEE